MRGFWQAKKKGAVSREIAPEEKLIDEIVPDLQNIQRARGGLTAALCGWAVGGTDYSRRVDWRRLSLDVLWKSLWPWNKSALLGR